MSFGNLIISGSSKGGVAEGTLVADLVAWWEHNEVGTGTRNDAHGANHLTNVNAATNAAGLVGNATGLVKASGQYVFINSNAAMQTGDIDFTIAAAHYDDSFSDFPVIFAKYDYGIPSREYLLYFEGSTVRFYVSPDGTSVVGTGSTSVSTATWARTFAWHDATANTINVVTNLGTVHSQAHAGGVHVGTAKAGTAFFNSGTVDTGSYPNGRRDETGIWKRVLTSDERTCVDNAGAWRSYNDIKTISCYQALYRYLWGVSAARALLRTRNGVYVPTGRPDPLPVGTLREHISLVRHYG